MFNQLGHTYEGNTGSQQQNSDQEVFKLLHYQLPQGFPWNRQKHVTHVEAWNREVHSVFTEKKGGTLQQCIFARFRRRKAPAQDITSGGGGEKTGKINIYLLLLAALQIQHQGSGRVIRLAGVDSTERMEKDKEHSIKTNWLWAPLQCLTYTRFNITMDIYCIIFTVFNVIKNNFGRPD